MITKTVRHFNITILGLMELSKLCLSQQKEECLLHDCWMKQLTFASPTNRAIISGDGLVFHFCVHVWGMETMKEQKFVKKSKRNTTFTVEQQVLRRDADTGVQLFRKIIHIHHNNLVILDLHATLMR